MVKVIGVSSVSGGGKTSLVKKLESEVPKSKALYFDEYEDSTKCPPIVEWQSSDLDYNQWESPNFLQDIKKLKQADIEYLFLDFSLGKENSKIGENIDTMIYIDTPLDVAMARRIIRDNDFKGTKDSLISYLNGMRQAYVNLEKVKNSSDHVVDGLLSIDEIFIRITSIIS